MYKKNISIIFILSYLLVQQLFAQDLPKYQQIFDEVKILTEFIKFDHPDQHNTNNFRIGICSSNEYYFILKEQYKNQKIQNKQVVIELVTDIKSDKNYQVLIFTEIAVEKSMEILNTLATKEVLTIGIGSAFINENCIIVYSLDDNCSIELINNTLAARNNIFIDLQLLEFAKTIK